MGRWLRKVLCLPALLPLAARAHSPIAGASDFLNGVAHPFVVPAHLMSLLAFGLLMGQRDITRSLEVVAALVMALLLGILCSSAARGIDADTVLLVLCALTGLAVVLARPLPRWALLCMAAGIGLAVGLGSSPEGLIGSKRWTTAAGTWLGTALIPVWLAATTELMKKGWMKIAVRVLGSWLTAAAILVLALAVMGPRRTAPVPPPAPATGAAVPALQMPATTRAMTSKTTSKTTSA